MVTVERLLLLELKLGGAKLLGGVVAGEVPALLALPRPNPIFEEGGNGGSGNGGSSPEGEVAAEP